MQKLIPIMFLFLTLAFMPANTNGEELDKKLYETENATDLFKGDKLTVQVFSENNQSISINKDDIYLMAQIVYAESCAEPFEGKLGVASVILNRLKYPAFPKSVEEVINQKNAFSCLLTGKANVIPDTDSYKAVIEAIKGNDPTNKATFFYNPRIATSTWMKNIDKSSVKTIGHHVFFKVN